MDDYMKQCSIAAMQALIETRHHSHFGEDGAEVLSNDAWLIAFEMSKRLDEWNASLDNS